MSDARYVAWPDPRSRSWALQSWKSGHFQKLPPPPFTMRAGNWPRILKLGHNIYLSAGFFHFRPSFCVTWLEIGRNVSVLKIRPSVPSHTRLIYCKCACCWWTVNDVNITVDCEPISINQSKLFLKIVLGLTPRPLIRPPLSNFSGWRIQILYPPATEIDVLLLLNSRMSLVRECFKLLKAEPNRRFVWLTICLAWNYLLNLTVMTSVDHKF